MSDAVAAQKNPGPMEMKFEHARLGTTNNLKSQILSFTILLLLAQNVLLAQEYSFDPEQFEKKPYEFIGSFKIQPEIAFLNNSSKLYSLSFFNKKKKDYRDSYFGSIRLKASYEYSKCKFFLDFKNQLTFTTNDDFENDFKIYGLYNNVDFSTNFSMQVGKKAVKWGKGYIWNPVSFAGRQKDINDIDTGLEGFWMLKLDYVKSLSGVIQNLAITPVIIPVTSYMNEEFQKGNSLIFILKNSLLLYNTDLDFYLSMEDGNFQRFGIDFAKNILPNWEIHGEYVFEKKGIIEFCNSSYEIEREISERNSYLLGSRILFATNTTIILEYLHNGSGLTEGQMRNFYNAVDLAENLSKQFLMKDYLYLKLSQPEPFDILYFTPSVYILYNINDKSRMIGGELNYSRFENINLKLKCNLMLGDTDSEFGEKISSKKISFQVEYIF